MNASDVVNGEVVATSFLRRFTVASARPLDLGLCGDENCWLTIHWAAKARNSLEENWLPLSE